MLRSPWVKYSVIALGVGLWAYGLAEQTYSSTATLTYVTMSLIFAAIALA